MNDTPAPLTDAELTKCMKFDGDEWCCGIHVGVDFARTLERQNAALQSRLDEALRVGGVMADIVKHVWANGRGREFFPEGLDGTQNEIFQDSESALTKWAKLEGGKS